ncbi:hypothetical protein AB0F52_30220 [Amycolatopsis sp. NPDC024027]|uniref:hypothetical protein n=1 Tax=Amycolatopsis sp. NPDC024027 TaxID=3154327 RepID=UPI00340773EE
MAKVAWRDAEVLPTAEQLEGWQVGPSLLATGKCFRCGDQANGQITLSATVTLSMATPARPIGLPQAMKCNCSEPHSGHPPSERTGCGAWWVVRAQSTNGQTFSLRQVTDPDLRRAARVVSSKLEESRSGITVAAEKWVPGVSALLGLFGLTTIIVARDAVTALPWWLRLVTFVLVCAALACAATATILIYRAAYGWPRKVNLTTNDDVLALAAETSNHAEHAGKKLRTSVALAAISAGTLLGSLGILWLQPTTPTPMAWLEYTTLQTGPAVQRRCVEITDVVSGQLKIKAIQGGPTEVLTLPLAQVTKFQPTTTCKGS